MSQIDNLYLNEPSLIRQNIGTYFYHIFELVKDTPNKLEIWLEDILSALYEEEFVKKVMDGLNEFKENYSGPQSYFEFTSNLFVQQLNFNKVNFIRKFQKIPTVDNKESLTYPFFGEKNFLKLPEFDSIYDIYDFKNVRTPVNLDDDQNSVYRLILQNALLAVNGDCLPYLGLIQTEFQQISLTAASSSAASSSSQQRGGRRTNYYKQYLKYKRRYKELSYKS